jgi:hypothetical protein
MVGGSTQGPVAEIGFLVCACCRSLLAGDPPLARKQSMRIGVPWRVLPTGSEHCLQISAAMGGFFPMVAAEIFISVVVWKRIKIFSFPTPLSRYTGLAKRS